MKNIKQLLILLMTILSQFVFSQELINVTNGCSFEGENTENEYYIFDASKESKSIVGKVIGAVGLNTNFTLFESNVKNALANTINGTRFILYNATFFEKFKGNAEAKWAAYIVLAHEIGHHLNNHDLDEKDMKKRKSMELQSDQFAGSVCRTLGASLQEALAGMEAMELPGETLTHPPKSARIAAITSGWKKQDELIKESEENAKADISPNLATDRNNKKQETIETVCDRCNGNCVITQQSVCGQCSGNGKHSCSTCHGTGKLRIGGIRCGDCSATGIVGCSRCNGKGAVAGKITCDKCGGKGKLVNGSIILTNVTPEDKKENAVNPETIKPTLPNKANNIKSNFVGNWIWTSGENPSSATTSFKVTQEGDKLNIYHPNGYVTSANTPVSGQPLIYYMTNSSGSTFTMECIIEGNYLNVKMSSSSARMLGYRKYKRQ